MRRSLSHYSYIALSLAAMARLAVGAARADVPGFWSMSLALPFTATASPAVADIDGDRKLDIVLTVDNIGDITRPITDPANVNAVYAYTAANGQLSLMRGWPQKTRDASLGVALADMDGDRKAEVVVSCGQDFTPVDRPYFVSRLQVWHGDGSPIAPWAPAMPDGPSGMAVGHAYAAPVVMDMDGDGKPEILQGAQGLFEPFNYSLGRLNIWNPAGQLYGQTQWDYNTKPWLSGVHFAMDIPPVIADLDGDWKPEVVAASYEGKVYAWNREGWTLPGFFPTPGATTRTSTIHDPAAGDIPAPIRAPIAAGDLDGDGRDEILAGGFDGVMRCWGPNGALKWRWPATGTAPGAAFTSGVAVGRLRRGNQSSLCAVSGDSMGMVTAWDASGRVLWRQHTLGYPTTAIEAEPVIGDVNNDGTQDVVVGGTEGWVYAFDGETGAILWSQPMPTSTLDPFGARESVLATPVLCDLAGNGHLNLVMATWQRTWNGSVWSGAGHLLVHDFGPNSYKSSLVDWPQYQQNAPRTGQALRVINSTIITTPLPEPGGTITPPMRVGTGWSNAR